jgi:hypothetical protein
VVFEVGGLEVCGERDIIEVMRYVVATLFTVSLRADVDL